MRGTIGEPRLAGLFEAANSTSLLWGVDQDVLTAPRLKLFGLTFANVTLDRAVADTIAAALRPERRQLAFVNAHVINTAVSNQAYADVLARCDTLLSDGSGMAIAARMAGTPFIANTNGTDWFPKLCKAADAAGVTMFLVGGAPGIAAKAAATIERAGFGRAIAGTHHGYFTKGGTEEANVIAAINASGATIVLAGFGVPLQDTWLAANRERIDAPVVAGVGGLFDFFSGSVSRAPKAFRAVGMEWVWRLALEPRRMWQRYLVGNVTFLARAIVESVRTKASRRAAIATAEPQTI